MAQHRDEPAQELHPVASDQPGLILHRPLRKLRQVAIVYALLPLVCAGLGGFVVIKLTEAATSRRLAALERDLEQRRAVNTKSNTERDRQIAELRRLVCVFADHSEPRDDQVEAVRIQYGCDGGPYPVLPVPGVPTPSSSGSPPSGGPSPVPLRSSGGSGGAVPAPGRSTVRALPQPAPRPPTTRPPTSRPAETITRPPSSPPSRSRSVLCVDLPLLPKLCV